MKQLKVLKDNEFIATKSYYYSYIIIIIFFKLMLKTKHQEFYHIFQLHQECFHWRWWVSFKSHHRTQKIHKIDTLNIIKDYVNNDYQFTRKTTIRHEKVPDLAKSVPLGTLLILRFTNWWSCSGKSNIFNHSRNLYAVMNILQYLRHDTLQKFGNNLLMTFILFLNIRIWKTFPITSTIFIKILRVLWRRKVMEN